MGSGAFLVEVCRQLGEVLLRAWIAHKKLPKVPADETPELLARRTIAQRRLYGVDKNPMAADLAKLSLWLATLAKDHPFTFLDHALKYVGIRSSASPASTSSCPPEASSASNRLTGRTSRATAEQRHPGCARTCRSGGAHHRSSRRRSCARRREPRHSAVRREPRDRGILCR